MDEQEARRKGLFSKTERALWSMLELDSFTPPVILARVRQDWPEDKWTRLGVGELLYRLVQQGAIDRIRRGKYTARTVAQRARTGGLLYSGYADLTEEEVQSRRSEAWPAMR